MNSEILERMPEWYRILRKVMEEHETRRCQNES